MARTFWPVSGMVAWLLLTSAASARPIIYASCFNDTDCGVDVCGGAVCDWNQLSPNPTDPEKPFTCVPAGTAGPKGQEGWCTSDDDCKCRDLGATCLGVYCTFTRAEDAPSVGGGVSAAGRPSTAGAPSTSGGSGAGGAPAKAGSAGSDAMSHEDTDFAVRTSRACSVSIVGRDAETRHYAGFAGLAVVLAVYCRKRARIPR